MATLTPQPPASRQSQMVLYASLALNVILIIALLVVSLRPGEATATVAGVNPTNGANDTLLEPSITPTPTNSPTLTAEPTASPTVRQPTPTGTAAEATPTDQPVPTATLIPTTTPTIPPPTATPVPSPTATLNPFAPAPGPDWLRFANLFRAMSLMPPLRENVGYSDAAQAHSRYMIYTNELRHNENEGSEYYSLDGHIAALNSNIAAAGWSGVSDLWPIDYWMSAPFHAVPLLNPRLSEAGYGFFRDENSSLKMTGAMDLSLRRAVGDPPASVTFPLIFPKDGGETWILKYSLPEFPNPLTSCTGFSKPIGPPLIVQLGTGEVTPNVTASKLTVDGRTINHCVIDETRYYNTDAYQQQQGRAILDKQDAIVLLPIEPLVVGKTYSASITVNGTVISWSFTTVRPPTDY